MRQRGIPADFGFWSQPSGFEVSQSLIAYSAASTYGRAFFVGLLNTLTVALSKDLAPRFRVNGIAPGPVPTDKFKEVRKVTEADFPRVAREWGVPLERLGTPDDIAALFAPLE